MNGGPALSKAQTRWAIVAAFVLLAAFHGFVQHDWPHAAADILSMFVAAALYALGLYVWNRVLTARARRTNRKGR